jgi:hypothetical protein
MCEAVRSAQVKFLVTARRDFHAELTYIDPHKLSIRRGQTLPRAGRGAINS